MSQLYNNIKTALLLGSLTALILFIGSFWGSQGVVIALIFAVVTNIGSYFFSDKIALATMHAEEVGPDHELFQIVEKIVARANLPMPRVYVSPTPAPNAFATGRNPKHAAVCATQGLLDLLNHDEIAGVMGHELAHVKHRDILITTIAATIAAAITSVGYIFFYGGMGRSRDNGNSNPIVGLLILLLAPLAAGLIQAAISRSREFNADTEGANLIGDPMPLASALEKIHSGAARVPLNVNPAFNSMFIAEPRSAMQSFANLFASHPPLEARLENLIGRKSVHASRYAA